MATSRLREIHCVSVGSPTPRSSATSRRGRLLVSAKRTASRSNSFVKGTRFVIKVSFLLMKTSSSLFRSKSTRSLFQWKPANDKLRSTPCEQSRQAVGHSASPDDVIMSTGIFPIDQRHALGLQHVAQVAVGVQDGCGSAAMAHLEQAGRQEDAQGRLFAFRYFSGDIFVAVGRGYWR